LEKILVLRLELPMLSLYSRWLTYLTALLYGILGMFLYLMPEQLAPVFAWKVTPFMTMTIGGWCLGNAWAAYITARRWKWGLVHTTLLYLWLFGIGELAVLLLFRDKLNLGHPIAWLYLATLIVNVITAALGVVDWIRLKPSTESGGEMMKPIHRTLAAAFAAFVGFLGIYGVSVQIGAPGTNGGIFPEVMSLFTLRSFAAFYLTLALAALPFVWGRSLNTVLHHAFSAYVLIVIVTVAAFVYIHLFDFAERPGGLLYFAAYLVVGIPLLFAFRKWGTGSLA
jgi:hypothetical protein